MRNLVKRMSTSARFLTRDWRADYLPEEVIFEVGTACNLACPMCARTAQKSPRPSRQMSLGIFRELAAHLPDEIERVAIAGLGEPALNPHLSDMVGILSARGFRTVLYTNGTLLDPDLSGRLLEAGLKAVMIPIDGASPGIYEKYRTNGNLEQTTANVQALLDLKLQMKVDLYVELQMLRLPGTEAELPLWRRQWKRPGVDTLRYKPDHMQIETRAGPGRQEGICPMPWRGPATVDIDGNVLPCCVQDPANVVLGNLAQTPLADIWNGDSARDIRQRFVRQRRKLSSCVGCDIPLPPVWLSALGNLLDPFLARRILARTESLLEFTGRRKQA